MKRAELLRYLQSNACELYREGAKHSVWWNPGNRRTSTVPRHAEIVEPTAWSICKDLGVPRPGKR
jgi:hypothetical protein